MQIIEDEIIYKKDKEKENDEYKEVILLSENFLNNVSKSKSDIKFIVLLLLIICIFSSIILMSLLRIIQDFSIVIKIILSLWAFASWFFIIIFYIYIKGALSIKIIGNNTVLLLYEKILEIFTKLKSEFKYVICYFSFMSIFLSGVILIIFLKIQYFPEPFLIILLVWAIKE